MKKISLLFICTLAIMISCNEDDSSTLIEETTDTENLYRFNLSDEQFRYEILQPEAIFNKNGMSLTTRGNNISANGDFVLNSVAPVDFSAMKNNGGIHGTVEFPAFLGGTYGETTCLLVEDNQAVIGFKIEEIGNPAAAFLIGYYMYFHVIDNGEGANDPVDQMYGTVYIASTDDCLQVCPTCVDWEGVEPLTDISSGNIQVKD